MDQEAPTAISDTSAVSSTMVTEMPSTPRKYSTFSARIQGTCSTNCRPQLPLSRVMPGSKSQASCTASASGTAETARAT